MCSKPFFRIKFNHFANKLYIFDRQKTYGNWLLCDFHIHTTLIDSKLSLNEVADLYGEKKYCLFPFSQVESCVISLNGFGVVETACCISP